MRLCIWVCCVPSVGEQLPLFGGADDLRRRNTALLSVGSVVAPHQQTNSTAGECTNFRNIKTIEFSIEKYSQISVYMTRRSIPSCGAAALPQLWESS